MCSSLLQYHLISLLSFISKLISKFISKEVGDYLTRNNFLSDKLYEVHFYRSTADVLTVITEIIIETLDHRFVTKAIALGISKAFGKVQGFSTQTLQL